MIPEFQRFYDQVMKLVSQRTEELCRQDYLKLCALFPAPIPSWELRTLKGTTDCWATRDGKTYTVEAAYRLVHRDMVKYYHRDTFNTIPVHKIKITLRTQPQ